MLNPPPTLVSALSLARLLCQDHTAPTPSHPAAAKGRCGDPPSACPRSGLRVGSCWSPTSSAPVARGPTEALGRQAWPLRRFSKNREGGHGRAGGAERSPRLSEARCLPLTARPASSSSSSSHTDSLRLRLRLPESVS